LLRLPLRSRARPEDPRGRRGRPGPRTQGPGGRQQQGIPRWLERGLRRKRRGERLPREQPEQLVDLRMRPELQPERRGSSRPARVPSRSRAHALTDELSFSNSLGQRSDSVPIPWWPRHTPSVGTIELSSRTTSAHTPKSLAFAGWPGPGDRTIASGSRRRISLKEIVSLRCTTGRAPSSPSRWYKLYTNES